MRIREAQIPFTLILTPTTVDDVLADTRLIATDYLAEAFTTLTEAGKATPGKKTYVSKRISDGWNLTNKYGVD